MPTGVGQLAPTQLELMSPEVNQERSPMCDVRWYHRHQ